MSILMGILVILAVLWAIGTLFLKGEDLSRYDQAPDPSAIVTFPGFEGPSQEHNEVVAAIQSMGMQSARLSGAKRLAFVRQFMDEMGAKRNYACQFVPVDAGGVAAEWVLAPGADATRRVLYIHGGAFIAGSPLSHRNITSQYSEKCAAAVLSVDYRLMPEHQRKDGIEDCRSAYRWILENGPDGSQPLSHLVISGDSAGGNLCLSLSAWARDQGLHAPDAVVALSPTVDATFTSPSIVKNMATDFMLGPIFAVLLKIPATVRNGFYLLQNRFNPANPVVSPVFGDLSGLPPTLIQVSEAEMLLDDARRYVNKSRACGSQATFQSWGHMLHVWQIFYPELPEARQAWDEIQKFVEASRQ